MSHIKWCSASDLQLTPTHSHLLRLLRRTDTSRRKRQKKVQRAAKQPWHQMACSDDRSGLIFITSDRLSGEPLTRRGSESGLDSMSAGDGNGGGAPSIVYQTPSLYTCTNVQMNPPYNSEWFIIKVCILWRTNTK